MTTRHIPIVTHDRLENSGKPIAVGSRAWFAWLADPAHQSFSYQSPLGTLTVRREKKRNGDYWYAYRTRDSKLHKEYLGKPDELTLERLQEAAANLSMPDLRVELFGASRVWRGDAPVTFKSAKALALVAYLAVQTAPTSRERLFALFWEESREAAARKNLRNLLWQIRTSLAPNVIEGDAELTLNAEIQVDVRRFEQAHREATASREVARRREAFETLRGLYRGPFLDGLQLDDAPDLEIWVMGTRERLHEYYLEALTALADEYRSEGRWEDVAVAAHAAIEQDALQEPMYRALMEAHTHLGDRAAALRHYDALRETLERELGVPPLPETEEMRAAILNGTLVAPAREPGEKRAKQVARSRAASAPEPFIGRAEDLAALDAVWQTAQAGHARALVVSGEAGIGKSKLWQHWSVRLAPPTIVLTTRCLPTLTNLPFAPIIDLLRGQTCLGRLANLARANPPVWLSDVARLLPELRDLAPQLPQPSTLPQVEEQRQIFEALTQSLGISTTHPTVLFIDDLQWADRATIDWLGYLLHRVRELPFLLVGAYRGEEATPPLIALIAGWKREGIVEQRRLDRLNREESGALVAALAGDMTRVDSLYEQSAGNPYFLIELLSAEPGTMPTALTSLIETRLQKLDSEARQVLQAAAVIQEEITFPILKDTSGRTDEETLTGLEALLGAALLFENGRQYVFSHPLVAQVVDQALSGARRVLLHQRAAEAMERIYAGRTSPVAARLWRHYSEAGNTEVAGYYAEQAGQYAISLAAWVDAVQFYERALAVAPTPARYQGLGQARLSLGDYQAAGEAFQSAIAGYEREGNRVAVARAAMDMAGIFLATGPAEQAVHWVQYGRRYIASGAEPEMQALAEFLLGAELRAVGENLDEADQHLSQAVKLAKKANATSLVPGILLELGNVRAQRGDLTGAIECYRELIDYAKQIGDPVQEGLGYNNTAYHLLLAGDTTGARAAAEEGLKLAETHDIQSLRQWLYSTRGEIALAEKEWDAAEMWFRRGLVEAERLGNHEQLANYQMNLALAARGRGELAQAAQLLESIRAPGQPPPSHYLQVEVGLYLAEVYAEQGNREAAREALARAKQELQKKDYERLRKWAERIQRKIKPRGEKEGDFS